MQAGYEFFDHTADIGVRVFGATLPELFEQAAGALYATLGTFAVVPDPGVSRRVELAADNLEDLLHDWLAELLYEFATREACYGEFVFGELRPDRLMVEVRGGRVDYGRSDPREEIKAVTYHRLAVRQQPDGTWEATVIFDV